MPLVDKIWMVDDVIVTSFKFLQSIVHISISIEHTTFVFCTNVQLYTYWLELKWLKVPGEGQMSQTINSWSYLSN